jgi:ferricrocin synthase
VSCYIVAPSDGNKNEADIEILPLGETGELCVGGYQLADGYVNREEQTQAAFIETPYGRLYRTGDKARILPTGELECLGRISDGQVKLRGQRIELGEVEQAILRTPGCHSAVAAVAGSILVVFCAVDKPMLAKGFKNDVFQTCRLWLPSFMVPGDVVVTEEFPRLPSGKVNRKHLIAEYISSSELNNQDTESYGPETIEGKLMMHISILLNLTVTASTVLPAAGLDSLTAIRLTTILQENNFRLNAIDILRAKTPAMLFPRIRESVLSPLSQLSIEHKDGQADEECMYFGDDAIFKSNDNLSNIRTEDIQRITPITPMQSAMLIETLHDPRAYCNRIELEFHSVSHSEEVLSWISVILKKNEILRSGFVYIEDKFMQVVFKEFCEKQLSIVSEIPTQSVPLDISQLLYPLRIYIETANSSSGVRMVLDIHHSIYDGWSMDMIISDLSRLARGETLQDRPQFSDVVNFYNKVTTNESDKSTIFWVEQMVGWRKVPFPQLLGHPRESSIQTRFRKLDVSPLKIADASKILGCGSHCFFEAALAWLWASIQGSLDVVIGTILSGRTIPVEKVSEILGPCIVASPLRVDIRGVGTIRDLLSMINNTNRRVMEHFPLPLMHIKKIANIPTGDSLYDMLFIYQESLVSRNPTLTGIAHHSRPDYLETKVLVEVEPSDQGFSCRLTYHADVMSGEYAEMLMEQLDLISEQFTQSYKCRLLDWQPSMPENLQSYIQERSNGSSNNSDLASRIETIVKTHPNSPAVCFAQQGGMYPIQISSLSYGDLNIQANRVARLLQQRTDLKFGSTVGVIMRKSNLLYVSILGVLKAGCSYLSISPDDSVDNIQRIVELSSIKLCITGDRLGIEYDEIISCQVLNLETIDLSQFSDDNLGLLIDGSQPACIVFTSGSTGLPKPVHITHMNMRANLESISKEYQAPQGSRMLQNSPADSSMSLFEIYFAWSSGMCLCSGSNNLCSELEKAIVTLGVTHLNLTPTAATLINRDMVPGVEYILTTGEALTTHLQQKWKGILWQGKSLLVNWPLSLLVGQPQWSVRDSY